jgi:hypothetical protein
MNESIQNEMVDLLKMIVDGKTADKTAQQLMLYVYQVRATEILNKLGVLDESLR